MKENVVFQKVLLAYDGSPGAKRALDVVLQLAQTTPTEVWAIAVEERLPHLAATIDEVEEEKAFANHFYEECLEMASTHARRQGVELRCVIRAGHAARTIVHFAQEGKFDLVVLGHSGHSRVWAMFLGTTAEKVSRHAPCSVLLVR
jgi:nucleotide-binding universal stress UspA family protein